MCADTVCTYPVLDFVRWSMGGASTILALKKAKEGMDTSRYGTIEVDPDGSVHEFNEKSTETGANVWMGPAYLPASAIDLFFKFYEEHKGDNLGNFFSWLLGYEKIHTWLSYKGEAFDVGNAEDFRLVEMALAQYERRQ